MRKGLASRQIAFLKGASSTIVFLSIQYTNNVKDILAFAIVRRPEKAWLVGLFARPLATLTEPLALRATGPEISRALRGLATDLHASVSIPQGSRMGAVNGPPPVLQITATRAAGLGDFDVIGGPIFLAGS